MADPAIVALLKGMDASHIEKFIHTMAPAEIDILLDDWDLWALPYQKLPEGEWRRWVLRAGRGAGKTLCAAKTVNLVARDRKKIRNGEIGIIARTYSDVRYTCIEGPSGILATASSDFRPVWYPGTGLLVWPNGVRGRIFSADKPEGMRGPNWSFIWADEMCHWPDVKKTWWEVIEPALRIGWARAIITTTPLPLKMLREMEKMADTVVTRASTYDNRWLPQNVRDTFKAHYEGTRMGRQELYGEIVEDTAGALWDYRVIEQYRVTKAPDLKRVVIAIDPAVTANEDSDETGLIAYGISQAGHGYVLEDATGIYTPTGWAEKAVDMYERYGADRIVAEVNQGGDMVEAVIRAVAGWVSYAAVRATRGKTIRAEPVAALYERGLVHHVGVYDKLETQLTEWTQGGESPDRLDALVWAATYLHLDGKKKAGPLTGYL